MKKREAEFMGGVYGNRGEATRLGSKNSGINCWVKSWETRISLGMRKDDDGKDLVGIGVLNLKSTHNLGCLNIQCKGFENKTLINGIEVKKLIEAYEIVNFPKKLEISEEKEK